MSVNANLRTRLAQVNASILELTLRLKSLEDNKQSIQDQLDGVVYPILTFPREITSEIFFHCLPPFSDVSDGMKGAPDSAQAPLLLLRVCRTWRDIAVSTPRLWVCLHLDLERLLDVGEPNLEKKIEDWFIRAGACLLSFSVEGHPFDDRHFELAATRAALVRFAPRLQTVSLSLQPRPILFAHRYWSIPESRNPHPYRGSGPFFFLWRRTTRVETTQRCTSTAKPHLQGRPSTFLPYDGFIDPDL
ncbi:hypothetical protein B0H14DRAFT_424163 [Mycena olivaceomarginata]|nr:hypothetical protein B0H14DRAFT_424163 [Mycena olivaceomarginata]